MINSDKTISANSRGVVISYGDSNKHMFTTYATDIKKIQLNGTSKYQNIKKVTRFTPVQEELYSKIVYGFLACTKEEINTMSKSKKHYISMTYTKAHRILNRWKQEIINEKIDGLFTKLFPKSPITKQMVKVKGYDDNLDVTIPFKDLGISRQAIANKLIEFNILPANFYQLT